MTIPALIPSSAPAFRDHLDTKAAAWIREWDGQEQPDAIFVGAPHSKSSISHSGAFQTPQAIRELFGVLTTYNIDHDLDLADRLVVRDAGNARIHTTDLALSRLAIYNAVESVCSAAPSAIPVILGGDHSITAPAFEAFRARIGGPVGLIQLDAHMDLRNLEDGGLTNGTPIRQLIESGTVRGEHIVQIGLHAFANAKPYASFAREHGITQVSARQVAKDGIDPIITRSLEIATRGTKAVYVTVDMDVLDQAYAPGVPAQIPGGMTTWQLFDAVLALGRHPSVRAIDIVEVDPGQDLRRATVRAAAHAILTFLTGLAQRSQ